MVLFLKPYFEKKLWAGEKLNNLYDCPNQTGEAWIVSGFNNKSSVIKNGLYKGKTLRNLWFSNPELFGNLDEKEFPILIKLIDAKYDLSIQVHPDDEYALKKHNSLGKFECWYILDDNLPHELIVGTDAKNSNEIKGYISEGILEQKLIKRKVEPNDLIEIEPGMVHAITKNTFLLEVQESSDITYRLYDYNRLPKRPLNISDSLNVIKFNNQKNPIIKFENNDSYKSNYFDISKYEINENKKLINELFSIIYILDGNGVINGENVKKNDSLIITNDDKEIIIDGNLKLLNITPKKKKESRLKMKKIALITGIVSQDGVILTKLLLEKNYEVHGLIKSKSDLYKDVISDLSNSDIVDKDLFFHLGDMTDSSNLNRLIENVRPDEIYHLASQSHIDESFELPEYTADVNAIGTLRILDAIKQNDLKTKIFNYSTCHLFSGDPVKSQNEETPFNPLNPYATSKLYSHFIVKNYRDAYGIYAVNGIMFTHSSELEDIGFVGRKITKAVTSIKNGSKKPLEIGNMYAKRDWGYAYDYCLGMWMSLQAEYPTDYVFSSGQNHTVKEFIELSFNEVGIDVIWKGEGLDEVGINKETNEIIVRVNPKYYRVSETNVLKGDSSKAKKLLNWEARTNFHELVQIMVLSDLGEINA